MKVAALCVLGVGLIAWLRWTHRQLDPPPAWKPTDRTIYQNRSRR